MTESFSPRAGYLIAAVGTAAALAAQHWLFAGSNQWSPMLTFVLPVVAAAWVGGVRSGLFATSLGLVIVTLVLWPASAQPVDAVSFVARLGAFLIVCAVITGLFDALHKARRREQELRERESRFAAIVDSFEDAIVGRSADGRITSFNPAAERLFGYAAYEVIGEPVSRLLPDGRDAEEHGILDRLRRGERLAQHETIRLRKDGTPIEVMLTASPIRDRDGNIVGASSAFRDITERKRAERQLRDSEQRFGRFMQHLPGLAWVKDIHGRYMYVNDAAERAFGRPRAELLGRTDVDLFPPEAAAQFMGNDALALASGNGVQVIETMHYGDGQQHHSIVSKFPIPGPDGGVNMVGGMAIDVTERLRAERALKEADRLKDEFLAMLAHELRNPLAPIRNAANILKVTSGSVPELQWASDVIERQVAQMSRLVDDLLDVSRITRGRIELRRQRIALNDAVQAALESSRPLIDQRGHEFRISLPNDDVWLDADPTRLCQVIANLLNNAAKFTEPGGRIDLSVDRGEAHVSIHIRDSGVGIPRELLDRVFELFVQVDRSLERSHTGLGIGLTLVKRLVEMHGGSVTAASAGPGAGSEFTVRLPLAAAQPSSATAPADTRG